MSLLTEQYAEMREQMASQNSLQKAIQAHYRHNSDIAPLLNHNVLPHVSMPDKPSKDEMIVNLIASSFSISPKQLLTCQDPPFIMNRRIAYLALSRKKFSEQQIAKMFNRENHVIRDQLTKAKREMEFNIITPCIVNKLIKKLAS